MSTYFEGHFQVNSEPTLSSINRRKQLLDVYRKHHEFCHSRYDQALLVDSEGQRDKILLLKQKLFEAKAKKAHQSNHRSKNNTVGDQGQRKNTIISRTNLLISSAKRKPPNITALLSDKKGLSVTINESATTEHPRCCVNHYPTQTQTTTAVTSDLQKSTLRYSGSSSTVGSFDSSEASSQQLSTNSNKTISEQASTLQVKGSVYDLLSVGNSRRYNECGEPIPNGLTTHLHGKHSRAQASIHLLNANNLVLPKQSSSPESASKGFEHAFKTNPSMAIQFSAPKAGQPNVNQTQTVTFIKDENHHPNQDVVLQQFDENKPIEQNNDIILPDDIVNFLNELAEQTYKPPFVVSDAVNSVRKYAPPNVSMNSQPKVQQNASCKNHLPQNCPQASSQSWQSCDTFCQNSYNFCTMHCSYNHPNMSSGQQLLSKNCCYPNVDKQGQTMQSCFNENEKSLSAHPVSSNNSALNMQKMPYNEPPMSYTANIPPIDPQRHSPFQNNCYPPYGYPQQQLVNMYYSDPQHFSSGNSIYSDSATAYPENNYLPNNKPNGHMQSIPNVENTMIYGGNQQNQYPSQNKMQPHNFNHETNSYHGPCAKSNYSSGPTPRTLPYNSSSMIQNPIYMNHNLPAMNQKNSISLNHNSVSPNHCNVSYPINNCITNNSSSNYLSHKSYLLAKDSIHYTNNQQNQYPSQTGMNTTNYNPAGNFCGSCSQPNSSLHNFMNRPGDSFGHIPQHMK